MAELNEFEVALKKVEETTRTETARADSATSAASNGRAQPRQVPTKANAVAASAVVDEEEPSAWGKIALLALVVFLLLGGMGGFFWWQRQKWRWEKIPMPEKVAQVPKEWPVGKLAERLTETGKVRDSEAFLEAAKESKLQTIRPGGYLLPAEAGPRDLAALFAGGPQLVKITFPEGWTVGQMARRLTTNGFVSGAELKALAYPPGSAVSPLEGRLFPDTYYLSPKAPAREVAARLQSRSQEIITDLPKPFPTVKGKPLAIAQIVTLASLVERETDVPDERPLIAGVLLNRLNIGMRLQCDATVQYARRRAVESGVLPATEPGGKDGQKARLLYRDLEIASPYNTYQRAGLPPGPICNPGQAALKAAARPEKSPYLFYVMSPKLGRHRFAKTFAEHKHNIALARQER